MRKWRDVMCGSVLWLLAGSLPASDWPAGMYGGTLTEACEKWDVRESQFNLANPPIRVERFDADAATFYVVRKRPGYSQHMQVASPKHQLWSEARLQQRFPATHRRLDEMRRDGLQCQFQDKYWGADILRAEHRLERRLYPPLPRLGGGTIRIRRVEPNGVTRQMFVGVQVGEANVEFARRHLARHYPEHRFLGWEKVR